MQLDKAFPPAVGRQLQSLEKGPRIGHPSASHPPSYLQPPTLRIASPAQMIIAWTSRPRHILAASPQPGFGIPQNPIHVCSSPRERWSHTCHMVEGRVCMQDGPVLLGCVNNSVRLLVGSAAPAVSPFQELVGRMSLQHGPFQHPDRQLRKVAEQRSFGVVKLHRLAVEDAPTQQLCPRPQLPCASSARAKQQATAELPTRRTGSLTDGKETVQGYE